MSNRLPKLMSVININSSKNDINNTYISGAGIGVHNIATRRILNRRASKSHVYPKKKIDKTYATFNKILMNNMSSNQTILANFFINFKYPTYTYLSNKDFQKGTYRITKPGIYILSENIIFNPNPDNDHMPTAEQLKNGDYGQAYHLGFFAAITIENREGVILDLNNYTIKQDPRHYIEQRFYANIELAIAPFIKDQGPGNFGLGEPCANNVLIRNGILGFSSHHGIHGNKMSNIILQNILIKDFDVAGIALNGGTNIILDSINVQDSNQIVPLSATYSQARFSKQFLTNLKDIASIKTITFKDQTITDMINILDTNLKTTRDWILNNNILNMSLSEVSNFYNKDTTAQSNILLNSNMTKGLDGNIYGLVFNVKGVVVNGFLTARPDVDTTGNEEILIYNTKINQMESMPKEVVGLSVNPDLKKAYGGNAQVGAAGDIVNIDVDNLYDNNLSYSSNTLADSQLMLGKIYNYRIDNNIPKTEINTGTTNISKSIVNWGENSSEKLKDIMDSNTLSQVYGVDSMGHVMKGNIGLFISGGKNFKVIDSTINHIDVNGNLVSDKSSNKAQGGDAHGILLTASTNIEFQNIVITNVTTENSNSQEATFKAINKSNWSKILTDSKYIPDM